MPERKLSARYPTDLPAWKALKAHQKLIAKQPLRELCANEQGRFEAFSLEAGDLLLDYSKNSLTTETRDLLLALADEAGLETMFEAMFSGDHINVTEDRAVLHAALRAELSDQVGLEEPGVSEVWQTLNEIETFVDNVQSGRISGATGRRLENIVNIGIGGSDLGPVMANPNSIRTAPCSSSARRRLRPRKR